MYWTNFRVASLIIMSVRLDRHINVGINLLQTAGSKELAGSLRFSPGAFQHDVMMTLYGPATAARSELNGTSLMTGVPA